MDFVYIIFGFIGFSQFFLMRVFTCLRRKKRLNIDGLVSNRVLGSPWPILSAHRGGSLERAENTLHAFKNAIE